MIYNSLVKTNVEKYVEYLHVEQTKMSKFDTTCCMSLDSVAQIVRNYGHYKCHELVKLQNLVRKSAITKKIASLEKNAFFC